MLLMNETFTRYLQAACTLLVWMGVGLSFLAIAADCMGIGRQPGFGWKQILLLTCGAGLSITSWLLRWLVRTGRCRMRPHLWPSIRDIVIMLSVTALIITVDIYFSRQLGLLAYPPFYDGIGYVLVAKSSFYALQGGALEWLSEVLFGGFSAFVPLWQGLMLLSFLLLGEGEWQAYTVRFWPTMLLLLLVFWVVRRRGCATVAWVAVLCTALLPTISVGLRSSGWEYFTGKSVYGWEWYLADLRPDLLFAVLLLWSVVPIIECAHELNECTWIVSGASAAMAVLVKSSTTPMLLLAGGLTITCVLIVNRHRLLATMVTAAWGIVPLAILLTPWILVGGGRAAVGYLTHLLTAGLPLWSDPNATFFSEAKYYWQIFPYHIGHWESWLLLGVGLTLWAAGTLKKRERDYRLLIYLLLAGVLYGLVSVTPAKNYFVGLPYYLLLWLFSWAALAPFLTVFGQRGRVARTCLVLFPTLYGSLVVAAAFYALHHWPAEKQVGPLENRDVTQQIAGDLRRLLTNEDVFVWVPTHGYPAALEYYMMDNEGRFPQAVNVDPTTSPPIPQFLLERVSQCKALLVYAEDIEEVAKVFHVAPLSYPYWRAISEWVKRPESSHRLVRTYRLWGKYPDRPILVHLYVRESGESREGKKTDKERPHEQ